MADMFPKRGHSYGANANMSEVKCAHKPKFGLTDLTDQNLLKLVRLRDKISMRKNINKYVHGK